MRNRNLRLPRLVESDPRGPEVSRILTTGTRPLRQGGDLEVAVVTLGPEMVSALRLAQSAGQVVRGLESAERLLAAEARGLGLADRSGGAPRGGRVSRLLVLADDGAERFYRRVETLLRRHGRRLLAVRLEADAVELGGAIFGQGRLARLLMLRHKEAVSEFLLAIK